MKRLIRGINPEAFAVKATRYLLDKGSWAVNACKFSPDGNTIAFTCRNGLKIWNGKANQLLYVLDHQYISDCAFSPDGQLIVTAGLDGTAKVWSVFTGQIVSTKKAYSSISACAYSPDGYYFLTVDNLNILHSWNAVSNENFFGGIGLDENRNGFMHFCTISPDGRHTVYNSWYQGLQVWDLNTGKPLHSLAGRPWEVSVCSFSPDGRLIVATGDDHQLWVWEAASGKHLLNLPGHSDHIFDFTFTPDGKFIISVSEDKTMRVWDIETGQSIREFMHPNPLRSIGVHPWAPRMLSGDCKGHLYLWILRDYRHGPIIQTALKEKESLQVQCPVCKYQFQIESDRLGCEHNCQNPDCQIQLKVNSFTLTP
jgi:WD40 repeat protein